MADVGARLVPRTIPAKLAALFALVIGAIAAFWFVFIPAQLGNQARESLFGRAQSIGEMAAYSVRSAIVFDDREGMEDGLEGATEDEDVLYVAVSDTTGEVLAYRQAEGGSDSDAHAVGGQPPSDDVYRLRIPVRAWDGSAIGFVSLGLRMDGIDSRVAAARQVAGLLSTLIFAVGMLAVVFGSRVVTRPLHDMVGTAERIANGDLSERADTSSRDEIGKLAQVFNVMVGRLQAANQELEESNRALEDRVEEKTRQWMKSEQLFRQAQKMEAVGRLAAGVAHDFNNLLTVINGHSELLLAELTEVDPIRESVENIGAAGASAASLTHQLLAFSRRQVLQPVDLDLNEVVGRTVTILERLLGENVTVIVRPSTDTGLVRADPMQIQQVLVNLAVNAKDAMPVGGHLTFGTGTQTVAPGDDLHEEGLPPGEYMRLTVSDDGHGMSEEVQAMAFEPFFSTKPSGKGTGLGLATVYGIVKQSGGHIRMVSSLGRGTTFSIYLPRLQVSGAHQRGHEETVSEGRDAESESILLVEDAHQVRHLARRLLEREGYEVVEADCGEVALERCAQRAGAFDLLLTDVVMPRMTGRELARRITLKYPSTALVYMSGYTDDEVVLNGVRDQGVTFLEKPFSREDLLRVVRNALTGDRPAADAG